MLVTEGSMRIEIMSTMSDETHHMPRISTTTDDVKTIGAVKMTVVTAIIAMTTKRNE